MGHYRIRLVAAVGNGVYGAEKGATALLEDRRFGHPSAYYLDVRKGWLPRQPRKSDLKVATCFTYAKQGQS